MQCPLIRGQIDARSHCFAPRLLEERQLAPAVLELRGIRDARRLDAQDGDLVEELPGGDGHEDVLHECVPGHADPKRDAYCRAWSSFMITWSTVIRSMTPRSSIFSVHGRR